ncbi:phage tail tape measure protein [Lentzea nigeriaca]|uniref:hypothetical protein n=1 Tax=Lentzea nigeriaca TaxID=1128665 RepID=UPI00195B6B70|nr:hypothetical protein [Lentzea nigeriaca]MBM7858987.1 F0F1-type ATP synthase assembly protein I [Lentzea nigeriaca]
MARGLTLTPGFGEGTEWTDGFSGAGMVDTVAGLTKAVQDKNDAAIAAYSVGLAFDVVGAALNPLGAVIGAGVGWLIDHIFFLREPLDLLMGDNIAIRQETAKITDEAKKYDEFATAHVAALKKLDGWAGEAADSFRKIMLQVGKELQAVGEAMNAAGKIMGTMGACVTATRSLVRDIIAMVVGNLIGGALVAAGLAPITFGASIVAFIGTAVATALQALSRILNHITKLKGFLTGAAKSTDELGSALAKMGDNTAAAGKGGGSATVPTPPPVKGPAGDAPTIKGGDGPSGGGAPPPSGPPVSKPPEPNGGGAAGGGGKTGTPDGPPVTKPPEPNGGGAAGGAGKTDTTPDGPPVTKPPETGGGSTSTSGVTPPPINTNVKPPQDIPLPPSPGAGSPRPPQDIPLPPSPGAGSPRPPQDIPLPPSPTGGPKPSGGGGGSTSTSGVTPPPINTNVKPPQDIPLPPSPGAGSPRPPQDIPLPPSPGAGSPRPPQDIPLPPSPTGGPKPPDATAPKPPDPAAPKPPDPNAPGTGGAGGAGGGSTPWNKLSWAEVKNHMDDFSKYGKDHLDDVLKTKFGKTPEEAAGISQWIKNFEELAAPGGHFMIAGKAFATGTLLHYAHELWKELAPDTATRKGTEGFMGDLRDYNAQH